MGLRRRVPSLRDSDLCFYFPGHCPTPAREKRACRGPGAVPGYSLFRPFGTAGGQLKSHSRISHSTANSPALPAWQQEELRSLVLQARNLNFVILSIYNESYAKGERGH